MAWENDNLKLELLAVKDQTKTDRELAAKLKSEALKIRNQARQELLEAEKRVDEAKKKAYADVWERWSFVVSVCDWMGNIWIAVLMSIIGCMIFLGNALNRADIQEVISAIMGTSVIALIVGFIAVAGLTVYLIAERPTLGKIALFLSVTVTIFSLACVEYLKAYKDINWLKCEIPMVLFVTVVIALLWDSEGKFRLTK